MIEERWYLTDAHNALFSYFETNTGNPVVALPTGTGKSVLIAMFCTTALSRYAGTRILVLTHVKELIEQNFARMLQVWRHAPAGIFSAGVGRKDVVNPIIFAGVQSIVNSLNLFAAVDLILVDEAHLISDKDASMYWKVLDYFKVLNPFVKIIGFTATAYRMGMGDLRHGGIFTDVAYNLCTPYGFQRLIAEGYLSMLEPRDPYTKFDLSNIRQVRDDYDNAAMSRVFAQDKQALTAIEELVWHGQDRQSWCIFASNIANVDRYTQLLNSRFGIPAVAVHSDMTKTENDDGIRAFRSGRVRAIVGNRKLTTGFDHKPIDLIALLLGTLSTPLWVQMLGRGTRPYDHRTDYDRELAQAFQYTKQNCLVLDYGGNTANLGTIDEPNVPAPKSRGKPRVGDAPVRVCPRDGVDPYQRRGCGGYNSTRAAHCVFCGFTFPLTVNISGSASTAALISSVPEMDTVDVLKCVYVKAESKRTEESYIRVAYYCDGLKTYYENVNVESSNSYVRKLGRDWFRQRYNGDPPETNDEILTYINQFPTPQRIKVWTNAKPYPKIMAHEF